MAGQRIVAIPHVGRRKNAVGHHIHVKIRYAQAFGHDLHRLLYAEHLAAVFQQGLPGVQHQRERTRKHDIIHEYSPVQR